MPRVQYSRPQEGHNITKPMPTPTNASNITAWVRKARKTIPEIPDCVSASAPWFVSRNITTEDMIMLELTERSTHNRCAVIIDRKFNNITGGR